MQMWTLPLVAMDSIFASHPPPPPQKKQQKNADVTCEQGFRINVINDFLDVDIT